MTMYPLNQYTTRRRTTKTPRQKRTKRKRDEEELKLIRGPATIIASNNSTQPTPMTITIQLIRGLATTIEANNSKQPTPTTIITYEFDTYGSYVANNLRKFCPMAPNIAQHKINEILFQGQLGAYDRNPQMQQSPPSQNMFQTQPSQCSSHSDMWMSQ